MRFYGYRFYSPELGRWLSRDPINESGGMNVYGITGNNPINKFDAYGLFKIDISDIEIGKCGGYGELATFTDVNNQIVQKVVKVKDYRKYRKCGSKCCEMIYERVGADPTFWEFIDYRDSRNVDNYGNCSEGSVEITFEAKDYNHTPSGFTVQDPDPTGAGYLSSYSEPIAWGPKPGGQVNTISVSWDCMYGNFDSDTIVH